MDDSTEQTVSKLVGRALEQAELRTYPSIDDVPDAVVNLVGVIASMSNTVLAGRYLRERIPRREADHVKEAVETFVGRWAARPTADDDRSIRAIMGRDLVASELKTFVSIEDISPDVATVAATLANHDVTIAYKYAHQRVPGGHLFSAMTWVGELLER
jgi:hypothetical protein